MKSSETPLKLQTCSQGVVHPGRQGGPETLCSLGSSDGGSGRQEGVAQIT